MKLCWEKGTSPRWPPCPYIVKTFKKNFFRIKSPMMLKLGMQHLWLKLYKVCINVDPWLTLTYFMARSNLVAYVFECGKLLQSHLMGSKIHQIDRRSMFLKMFDPFGLSAPAPGLYTLQYMTIIFKHLL